MAVQAVSVVRVRGAQDEHVSTLHLRRQHPQMSELVHVTSVLLAQITLVKLPGGAQGAHMPSHVRGSLLR
jgi:hypothetical protein